MAGNDDGEFELILGNKQLLSVLFIVIVLLGVFFAMGFLAGRTTGGSAVVAQNDNQARQPLAVDSTPAPSPLAPEDRAEAPLGRATEPFAIPPAATKETTGLPATNKKGEESAVAKPLPGKVPSPASGGFIAVPPAGIYLQAAATRRADAEAMLGGIRTKTGLGGYVTPSPKSPELFRVIVGPLTSKAQQAEVRAKLGEIGIKSPFSVTY